MDGVIRLMAAAAILGGLGNVGFGPQITPASTVASVLSDVFNPRDSHNNSTVLISPNGRQIEYLYQPLPSVVGFAR